MAYLARYTSLTNSNTSDLTLDATTDAAAVAEVRQMVEAGYRNETACLVALQDGRTYGASNKHGNAVGGYVE